MERILLYTRVSLRRGKIFYTTVSYYEGKGFFQPRAPVFQALFTLLMDAREFQSSIDWSNQSIPIEVNQTRSKSIKPDRSQSNPIEVNQTRSKSIKPDQSQSKIYIFFQFLIDFDCLINQFDRPIDQFDRPIDQFDCVRLIRPITSIEFDWVRSIRSSIEFDWHPLDLASQGEWYWRISQNTPRPDNLNRTGSKFEPIKPDRMQLTDWN